MPLTDSEVLVGVVAYFTIDALRAEPAIERRGGSPDAKPRPFVCYAISPDGKTFWTPLSTQKTQNARNSIPSGAIVNATGRFVTDTVLVTDGLHTYSGPATSFAKLSNAADRYHAGNRVSVKQEGIEAALRAVTERAGQLPE